MSENDNASVVRLFPEDAPNENGETVALLEKLLERAKSGLIAGIAVAVIAPDGFYMFDYKNVTTTRLHILGAITAMQFDLASCARGEP